LAQLPQVEAEVASWFEAKNLEEEKGGDGTAEQGCA
jgi:hypothetical protein